MQNEIKELLLFLSIELFLLGYHFLADANSDDLLGYFALERVEEVVVDDSVF